jgi:DNA-binding beta-propeller fold protein YncE
MPFFSKPLRIVLLVAAGALACEDGDDGMNAGLGVGDLRLLVATRDPDAQRLFDLQNLTEAFDSPEGLPAEPIEARSDDAAGIFVTAFTDDPGARAFESETFKVIPASGMAPGGFVAFDGDHGRIYTAADRLAFFDAGDFSPLGFPSIDLGGDASDVVYDPATRRIFVAVTRADGPVLRVLDGDNLSEVAGSPLGLPGGPGARTGDLLLLSDRGQIVVALPEASQLAVIDPATLRALPRTPIALRTGARELAFDPQRERFYAAAADGNLEAIGATDFAVTGGFPRRIGDSVADLAFDPATQQLVAADAAAREIVVLDALTLTDELNSPISLDGVPVSVEVMDLR